LLLLLLLHLKLPLLHLLQHLLRRPYARLLRRRWWFRFRCALILLALVGVFILRIGSVFLRLSYVCGRGRVVASLGWLRIRVVWSGFGHQHHPHQLVGIGGGAQQYVIEA
jgi:hypothetical protein